MVAAMRPLSLLYLLVGLSVVSAEGLQCSATNEIDPALKEMTYDVGDGEQKTLVYVEPDVTTFYQGNAPASTKVKPKHNGFSAKFINMSNQKLILYW